MPVGSGGLLDHDGCACPGLQERFGARPTNEPLTSPRDHALRRRDARCARHTGAAATTPQWRRPFATRCRTST